MTEGPIVALTFKTELDSEISMSGPNFSFHLKVRLPRPLPPPSFPSCFLATLAGRDCRLLFPPRQPQVSPEHYTIKHRGRDKAKGTRKFLLHRYIRSVFFLSAWLMFSSERKSHLLSPSDLNSHGVQCSSFCW